MSIFRDCVMKNLGYQKCSHGLWFKVENGIAEFWPSMRYF